MKRYRSSVRVFQRSIVLAFQRLTFGFEFYLGNIGTTELQNIGTLEHWNTATLKQSDMKSHLQFDDQQFEQEFQNATLEPELFTHEAHLRLAWIHIRRYGLYNAIANITTQLKQYVHHLGAADKYNETVTIAAIKAVHHFMLKSTASNFQDFISNNARLKTGFKELLRKHYVTDIFRSEKAKKTFMAPELLPFDA